MFTWDILNWNGSLHTNLEGFLEQWIIQNIWLTFIFIILSFAFVPSELPPFRVCPSVFVVPVNYHCRGGGSRHTPVSNNDEELLQYAIHQSLIESRTIPSQVRITIGFSARHSHHSLCSLWHPPNAPDVHVIVGGEVGGCWWEYRWRNAQKPEWQVQTQDVG